MAVIEPAAPPEIARLKRRLFASTLGVLVGIGWCTTGDSTLGGLVTVTAFASLVVNLHRFGRTGPG